MGPEGATTVTAHEGHPPTTTGVSNEKLAMWAFLGSECLLFGALISTYFLYRGRGPDGGGPVGPQPTTSTTSPTRRSARSCC